MPWLGNLIVLTVRVNDFLNWRCIDNVELMDVHVYKAEESHTFSSDDPSAHMLPT